MKKILAFFCMVVTIGIIPSIASNGNVLRVIDSQYNIADATIEVSVEVINPTDVFTSFQFDVIWDADAGFNYNSSVLNLDRSDGHIFAANLVTGTTNRLRLLAYSFASPPNVFNGNSGEIVKIILDSPNNPGIYEFSFTGTISLRDPDNNPLVPLTLESGVITICDNITITEEIFNVSCFGLNDGVIGVAIEGGEGPYTFAWTGPDNFESNDQNINGLVAGDYLLNVTDGIGCHASAVFTIEAPNAIKVTSVDQSPIPCFGGTSEVIIFAEGGTGELSFTLIGETNTTGVFNVPAGSHIYSVTDVNLCGPVTGTLIVTEPAALEVSSAVVTDQIICFGGTAKVTIVATGGTEPYTYSYAGQSNDTGIFYVLAGNYEYSVTDDNNCSPVTGTLNVNQPPKIEVELDDKTDVTCFGDETGAIQVNVNGGAGEISFMWTGPGTFSSTLQNLENIPAGVYYLTVKDANNCEATLPPVTITQNDPVQPPVGVSTVVFFNGNEHTADAIPHDGTNLIWYDSPIEGNITTKPTGTEVGTYKAWAVAEDIATGCTSDDRTEVTLTITLNFGDADCDGEVDIADINLIIAHIFDNSVTVPCFFNADLVPPFGELDLGDLNAVIAIILSNLK